MKNWKIAIKIYISGNITIQFFLIFFIFKILWKCFVSWLKSKKLFFNLHKLCEDLSKNLKKHGKYKTNFLNPNSVKTSSSANKTEILLWRKHVEEQYNNLFENPFLSYDSAVPITEMLNIEDVGEIFFIM